jgi:hypothetical protein
MLDMSELLILSRIYQNLYQKGSHWFQLMSTIKNTTEFDMKENLTLNRWSITLFILVFLPVFQKGRDIKSS